MQASGKGLGAASASFHLSKESALGGAVDLRRGNKSQSRTPESAATMGTKIIKSFTALAVPPFGH